MYKLYNLDVNKMTYFEFNEQWRLFSQNQTKIWNNLNIIKKLLQKEIGEKFAVTIYFVFLVKCFAHDRKKL